MKKTLLASVCSLAALSVSASPTCAWSLFHKDRGTCAINVCCKQDSPNSPMTCTVSGHCSVPFTVNVTVGAGAGAPSFSGGSVPCLGDCPPCCTSSGCCDPACLPPPADPVTPPRGGPRPQPAVPQPLPAAPPASGAAPVSWYLPPPQARAVQAPDYPGGPVGYPYGTNPWAGGYAPLLQGVPSYWYGGR